MGDICSANVGADLEHCFASQMSMHLFAVKHCSARPWMKYTMHDDKFGHVDRPGRCRSQFGARIRQENLSQLLTRTCFNRSVPRTRYSDRYDQVESARSCLDIGTVCNACTWLVRQGRPKQRCCSQEGVPLF